MSVTISNKPAQIIQVKAVGTKMTLKEVQNIADAVDTGLALKGLQPFYHVIVTDESLEVNAVSSGLVDALIAPLTEALKKNPDLVKSLVDEITMRLSHDPDDY